MASLDKNNDKYFLTNEKAEMSFKNEKCSFMNETFLIDSLMTHEKTCTIKWQKLSSSVYEKTSKAGYCGTQNKIKATGEVRACYPRKIHPKEQGSV